MSKTYLRARHRYLHIALDELAACFLRQYPHAMPSQITLEELLLWSHRQTIEPHCVGSRAQHGESFDDQPS